MQRVYHVPTKRHHGIYIVDMKTVPRLFGKPKGATDALPSPSPLARNGWTPTHRHKKGGYYRLISYGTLEADRSSVCIYDDAVGTVWVRSSEEFEDGRFTPLAVPLTP